MKIEPYSIKTIKDNINIYCYAQTGFGKNNNYLSIPTEEQWIKLIEKYHEEAEKEKLRLDDRLTTIKFNFNDYGTPLKNKPPYHKKYPIHEIFWWRLRDLIEMAEKRKSLNKLTEEDKKALGLIN